MFKHARWYKDNKDRLEKEKSQREAEIYNSLSSEMQSMVDALYNVSFSIEGPNGKKSFNIKFDFDTREFDCTCSDFGLFENTRPYKSAIDDWVNDRLKDYGVSFKERFWFYLNYLF